MKDGFIKVAAVTPSLRVADTAFNSEKICECIDEVANEGAKLIVLPELSVTGYSCRDLFLQDTLLDGAKAALMRIIAKTKQTDALIFAGLPLSFGGSLFNVAAVFKGGELLAFIPKTFIPNYSEFYEMRQFTAGPEMPLYVDFYGKNVPLGSKILFTCQSVPELVTGCELCEDVWAPNPPSISAALSGATVIANCSASDETIGKADYRRALISGQSARLLCGYVYANSGPGESTTDLVFGGHNIIAENGHILSESSRFKNEIIYSEIDVKRILLERRRSTSFVQNGSGFLKIPFSLNIEETRLTRYIPSLPFVPQNEKERAARCEEILNIQSAGLSGRIERSGAKTCVIGISGGLDSTLALLVCKRAFERSGKYARDIIACTMPCFGTTDRTYNNACALTKCIGASLREIPIADAVSGHFKDIGFDPKELGVTYENCQARERTQVLMDVANQTGGLVVGTGDMSELALGWATYNGDHMSMYGVNASVPKTLVRHLVKYAADCADKELQTVLEDILKTPVSPELLPPKDGKIAQKTESIVGPYELHDFFLYNMVRAGFAPLKIKRLAIYAFDGKYDEETIVRWLTVFIKRFFSQQFKRSCIPDGPKVGTVALSPRGDWRMPSDARADTWLEDLK